MKRPKNADESVTEYVNALVSLIKDIDEIDSNFATSSSIEPQWWVSMMNIREQAEKQINKYKFGLR